jgi:hypothetical protein
MKFAIPILLVVPALAFGQSKEPTIVKPDDETMATIRAKLEKLQAELPPDSPGAFLDPTVQRQIYADVAIYAKAAEWMIRHGEFYGDKAAGQLLQVLDAGLKRAAEVKANPKQLSWLAVRGKPVARGYWSPLDDSIQPYLLTVPEGYDPVSKSNRLDVVLAGRDGTKTEMKWLHRAETAKPTKLDRLTIEPYGRGNNAYRWAGERDVFDCLEIFREENRFPFDPTRVVLRGFSMGGAGTWHLGLHHPTRFAAISPGAGFTVTKGYAKLPESLPDYVEKCLHIYDAVDYAENSFNVPVVAYSGEKDPQIAAARHIERRLAETNAKPITHIIAPGLEHKQPPDWWKQVDDELVNFLPRPRVEKVDFTTYTPTYGTCQWLDGSIRVAAQTRQYERSNVKARMVDGQPVIDATNVRMLYVELPTAAATGVTINGVHFPKTRSTRLVDNVAILEFRDEKWKEITHEQWADSFHQGRRKGVYHLATNQLVGPIDDAFTSWFAVMGPTGVPMHKTASLYGSESLKRFDREWDKWMRGKLQPLVRQTGHIALFGDPGSNAEIAKLLPQLPITWTDKELIVNGVTYDPKTHVPVLIYPNPADVRHYVVINSGHTFHDADFKGTNALLFPKLGDWAVLKPTPTKDDPCKAEVVAAGLFDENWQFPKK